MLDNLLLAFEYEYMRAAIFSAGIVGVTCALLSVFLILKRWSLLGDALSHSVVPGVAAAYALSLPYIFGAFFTAILAALGIISLAQIRKFKADAVMGLVFSSFFAFGLVLIALNPSSIKLSTIIYGDLLAITEQDLWHIIILSSLVILVFVFKWRDLVLIFFDEMQARAVGISVFAWQLLFFALLSTAVVAALQVVGAILVVAMLIIPGATAYLLSDRFGVVVSIAALLGGLCSSFGAYLSFFLDLPSAAIIVLLQTSCFFAAYFFAPKHGIYARKVNKKPE